MFEKRKAHKRYIALLRGHVPVEMSVWSVDKPIGEHLDGTRMSTNGKDARSATSRFTVLRRAYIRLRSPPATGAPPPQPFQSAPSVLYPVTLVRLEPLTGRRHQLRVHCAHSGFPILGDIAYDRVGQIPPLASAGEPSPPPDIAPPPEGRPLVHWASRCATRTYLHAEELHMPISEARGGELHIRAPEPFSAELEDIS